MGYYKNIVVAVDPFSEKQFAFDTSNTPYREKNKQLELFFKIFIAYMIYYAGGHSLDEYFMVLSLPIVQREFQILAGFQDLTLINLFQKDNQEAFNKTREQTIIYNDNILLKKKLHLELDAQHKIKRIVRQAVNQTHPALVGTISLNLLGNHASYTIIDSSIIGAALLFAFIRLLDNKSIPENRHNDLSQRFKQLCLVLCMVTVAHTVGAKITKQEKTQQPTHHSKAKLSTLVALATSNVLDYSIFRAPEELTHISNENIIQKHTPSIH